MLVDLVNNAEAIFDSVKEIRKQARSEIAMAERIKLQSIHHEILNIVQKDKA